MSAEAARLIEAAATEATLEDARADGEVTSHAGAACPACLRRSWLIAQIGHHLDHRRFDGRKLAGLLDLEDLVLVQTVARSDEAELRMRHAAFDPGWLAAEGNLERVCLHDPRYPTRLRATQGAPAVLHLSGQTAQLADLLASPAVAIVGSRKATPDGVAMARRLAGELAAEGILIVSGLAVGIDTAAHEGALEAGGRTVSILPCGTDVPYPKRSKEIREKIGASGALVSELPPSVLPRPWAFPARNRIIAGLCDVLVVVEAAQRSGALSAARLAQHFERPVGSVPGPIDGTNTAGTLRLLQDGAHPVIDASDVRRMLAQAPAPTPPADDRVVRGEDSGPGTGQNAPEPGSALTVSIARVEASLDDDLRALLTAVRAGRDSVGALTAEGFRGDKALTGLAMLELKGLLTRRTDGRYIPVNTFAALRLEAGHTTAAEHDARPA